MPSDEEVFVRTIAKKFGAKTYKYAYLVENQRLGGKIRQRLVLKLGVAEVISKLFNQDFSLVFYELSSTYFEGRSCPLAAYGYSRDHRDDKLQVAVGLVVT